VGPENPNTLISSHFLSAGRLVVMEGELQIEDGSTSVS